MRTIIFVLILCFSFQAHAETLCMSWPKTINIEKLRAVYLAETGEHIQKNLMEDKDGANYLICSQRAKQGQLDKLKADRNISVDGDIKTRKDIAPDGWIQKEIME